MMIHACIYEWVAVVIFACSCKFLTAAATSIVAYNKTFVMPESPRWLVSKDRDAEAKEVLKLVYPEEYNVDIIARKIKENIAAEAIAEHAMGW